MNIRLGILHWTGIIIGQRSSQGEDNAGLIRLSLGLQLPTPRLYLESDESDEKMTRWQRGKFTSFQSEKKIHSFFHSAHQPASQPASQSVSQSDIYASILQQPFTPGNEDSTSKLNLQAT